MIFYGRRDRKVRETMSGTAQVRGIRVRPRRDSLLLFGIHFLGEEGPDGEPLQEPGTARGEIHEDHLVLVLQPLLEESEAALLHATGVRLRPVLYDAAARFLLHVCKVSPQSPLSKKKIISSDRTLLINSLQFCFVVVAPPVATEGEEQRQLGRLGSRREQRQQHMLEQPRDWRP